MLRIEKSHVDEMIAHSQEENPNECCGILAGRNSTSVKLYRITNTMKSPTRYLMDPQEQLDAMMESRRSGSDILAFYHSHPQNEARPSQIDVRMAVQSGWLDVVYFIVSLENEKQPNVRAFRISQHGEIVEQEFDIIQ